MKAEHVLIIGTVWPEPGSSAAGSRTLQLIEQFQRAGWKITFACAAGESEYRFDLSQWGIQSVTIELNKESFNDFIKELDPTIVLFDRFMTEEQFGWRVAESCPDAQRIIDTIDLHCLRTARQQALKEKTPFHEDFLLNDVAKREIASILRSDLSIMISQAEVDLLKTFFKVPGSSLQYTPFLLEPLNENTIEQWKTFEERNNFISIGNFLHEPNWDAVRYLKESIWPLIRKQLPKAELHIYGAYASQKAEQLHNEKEGFLIKGRAGSAKEVMSNARVCLAPLRFGAGMKGKLIDAMESGTPNVTTAIGAESMHADLPWSGSIAESPEEIAASAVLLYTDINTWRVAQQNGVKIINQCFEKKKYGEELVAAILEQQNRLKEHRKNNFIGSLLMHHTLSSTKYMSKWIEEKNKK
ncbi:MAG: hypothetical protein K0S33_1576 [Bacteroidetes bacterium]|jgi:glycosyltransferase involved in cell wall biosynthesis|nr:hypothetical protein [Bacteroidota bacterium]